MTDVTPLSKETQLHGPRVACPCGCGRSGALRGRTQEDGSRHVRGCGCRPCIGARSRAGGLAKQRKAKKLAGVPQNRFHGQGSDEENWLGAVRLEVKSGNRMANPIWLRYFEAERQSDGNKAVGDARLFLALFMPSGMSDGLFVGRLSNIGEIVDALYEERHG